MAVTRRGIVFDGGIRVGVLEEYEVGYRFTYDRSYLHTLGARAVSLSLPLREQAYEAEHLFPFFSGLLAEGQNKALQCRLLRIDEADDFGRLLRTAHSNVIGSVTVVEVEESP
ncbi:MAG: HipA N-terminal domain-containing protein [Deltaproteobacteria bacterium]|nr:HipA N-terminal domain-containing protein [Deltaproteobacteria bacterium]